MRAFLVNAQTGEFVASASVRTYDEAKALYEATKDLVVGYPQQPQRVGGVVEQPPTSQQIGGRRKRRRGDHTHDPERPGGLLNGRKP